MKISKITKLKGGFYKVGDKLTSRESDESPTDIARGIGLPYTTKGFLPEHTATATTSNPPLAFDEAMELREVYLDEPNGVSFGLSTYMERDAGCGEFWSIGDAVKIDLAVRRGHVYAHDPEVHPPTSREDG
jgi:hypothetical protein